MTHKLDHSDPSSVTTVTVVMAAHLSRARIATAIKSLRAQTLAPERFDVLVVVNGPDDGTAEYLETMRTTWRPLQLRVATTPDANASAAYNLGIDLARGDYITFVDDDDWVSPQYLERLLDAADPRKLVLAPFGDVTDTGSRPNFDNYLNRAIFRFAGLSTALGNLPQAASANCGKLVHREIVGSTRFDPRLRSGMDIAFWCRVITAARLPLCPLPALSGAVYYRHTRAESISRAMSDRFALDRLEVIAALEGIKLEAPMYENPLTQLQRAQAGHLGNFLAQAPEKRQWLLAEIKKRDFEHFPYDAMNDRTAKTLVIAYAFPPFNDTSAMVVARRINRSGLPVDVISQDMSNIRGRDDVAQRLVEEHVGRAITIAGPATFANWDGIERFVVHGYRHVEQRLAAGKYTRLYSRSMLPASHILAAIIKVRHPDITWVAEFSDPMRHDSSGAERMTEIPESDVCEEVQGALTRSFPTLTPTRNMWAWVEEIALGLADEILLTNENQKTVMARDTPDELRDRFLRRATVERHPTLPPEYYALSESRYELPSDRVNLGYFGVFYPARGVGDVTSALQALPVDVRDSLLLHIFSDKPDEVAAAVAELGLADWVRVNPYEPYLNFLNLATRLDWLIVTDARAGHSHGINPYLPSKYSDYVGAGTKIWAIVDPGSVLDTLDHDAKTALDDNRAAVRLLREIAAGAPPSAGHFEPARDEPSLTSAAIEELHR